MKVKITVLLILCSCLLLLTQRTEAQDPWPNDEASILEKKSAELPVSNISGEPLIEENATEIPRGEENNWSDIECASERANEVVTFVLETTETTTRSVTGNVAELVEKNGNDSKKKIFSNLEQEQNKLESNVDAVKVALSQASSRVRVEPQNLDNSVVSVPKDYPSEVREERMDVQVTTDTKMTIEQDETHNRNEEENRQSDVLVNEAAFLRKQVERAESERELQVFEKINEELTDAVVGNSLTLEKVAIEIEGDVVAQSKDTTTDMDLLNTTVSHLKIPVSEADAPSRSELEITQIVKSVEQTELPPANKEKQPNFILFENELLSTKTLAIEGEEVKDVPANEDTTSAAEETTTEVTTISNDESVTEMPKIIAENQDIITETPETNSDETVTASAEPTTASLCTTPGRHAVENDCRAYITCTHAATGELQRTQTSCPTSQAYDPELQRCSRDLSPCTDNFRCELEGTYADPSDNTSYYWCVASRLSTVQHIYHIQCGSGQIYTPELGKCFVDMTNLQNLSLNYELYMSKSPDEECVREEVKVLRAEEKAKLKAAKLREKIQKKYEKELLKKAAKEAKEQAKLQGISLDVAERSNFVCTQDGSYVAAAESVYDYFICTGQKKGKFKAVGMKCTEGQHFSATQNMCVVD
ncbi:uncharacterized protein LOC101461053 [Ceratitis capitata]|uniref:uncharacterized protein LOC101461053 n=1 Tax=Ceratitis capitata TaxID=7213 RepID=UPI00032A4102|nr:uncharacterized protein LOC101461053 [Ceratitis capitata]